MPKRKIETITGRSDLFTKIQLEFLQHPDFLYLRKGEFANALQSAWAHLDAVMTGIGIKVVADITAASLKAKLADWRRQPRQPSAVHQRDLRFIVCEKIVDADSLVGTEALCETGFQKRLISAEQAGAFRYYVSSQGYLFFFRNRDGSFHGIRGEDIETRDHLRDLFLDEWHQAQEGWSM